MGNALKSAGRYDEAREAYRKAIMQDPDFYVAHYNLGALVRTTVEMLQTLFEVH